MSARTPPVGGAAVILRRRDDRVLYPLLALLLAATLTRGDLDVTATGPFRDVYDALGASLLRGEATLPRAVIGCEAFVMPWGRVMYFGPLPALPRIALNAALPSMVGRWSVLSCLLASLVAVWASRRALGLALDAHPALDDAERNRILRAGTALLALGSPLVHLVSDGNLYFEAIAWAAAFALAAVSFLVEITLSLRASTRAYAALGACGACALLTRVTFGAAVLLAAGAVALVVLRTRELTARDRGARIASLALPALVGVAAQLAYNRMRWGSALTFIVPDAYVFLPSMREAFAQGQVHPRRLPWALYNYAVPAPRFFSNAAPFVVLGRAAALPSPVLNGSSRGFLPLTLSAPPLLYLAARALRDLARAPLSHALPLGVTLAFGAQALVILGFYHMAQRYTVEFLPGLVYLACLAVRALPREPAPREAVLRRVTLLSMVALACNLLSQSYWVNVEARV